MGPVIMVSKKKVRFQLSLSTEKYMAYYKGQASSIQVRSLENKTIRFPASAIRPFLMHDGIHGVFEIHFDEHNKLKEIIKLN